MSKVLSDEDGDTIWTDFEGNDLAAADAKANTGLSNPPSTPASQDWVEETLVDFLHEVQLNRIRYETGGADKYVEIKAKAAAEIRRRVVKARLEELKSIKQCGHNTNSIQFRIDILESQL